MFKNVLHKYTSRNIIEVIDVIIYILGGIYKVETIINNVIKYAETLKLFVELFVEINNDQ